MPVRRTAASVVLLGLLAGCGSPSTRARSLPPLGPSAPALTTTDPGASPAGAAAFARSYFAEITKGYATADPTVVTALSLKGCKTCDRFIESITTLRDQHERVTPVAFTLRYAEAPATDGRTARVDIQYDVPASTRYDSAGRVIYREQATVRALATVHLVRVGRSWQVAEIT